MAPLLLPFIFSTERGVMEMTSNLLNKVKIALRITHNYLDSDIEDTINAAKQDMIRAGVSEAAINSPNEFIEGIIKTYCLYVYAPDDKQADGYFKSYQYQLENARKSSDYKVEEA